MHELEQAWLESLELEGHRSSSSSKRLNHTAQSLVFEHLFVVNKELPKIGKIPTENEENRPNPHPTDKTGFVFHNRYDIDRKMKQFKDQDEKYHNK